MRGRIGRLLQRISAVLTLRRLLRIAAIFTILGLALMVWSMLKPSALPVIVAMSVGQVFGTTAFAIYLYVIVSDLRQTRRVRRSSLSVIDPMIVAKAKGDRT